MRVIYTSKGMSKKFGVRVIYRKTRYLVGSGSQDRLLSFEQTVLIPKAEACRFD
jgi:hypothetical protein